ncbi:zinc finger, CCHC-type containing protein [Tanacetum coccineum]
MGDDHFAPVHGKGSVVLEFSSRKSITLFNVLYVPKLRKNLISGPVLNKCGYTQVYESDKYILSKSGVFVGFGYYNNGMFMLNLNKVLDDSGFVYIIIYETTAPYTPQQNGVAERKNRALKEMVNSMLSYSSLSDGFWGEAMLMACYLLNMVPNKRNKTILYELLYKKRPNLSFLRVWGCRAVVRLPDPKRKTLGEKESRDAIFDENHFSSIPRPKDIIPNSDESQRDDHSNDVPSEILEPRKSKRARKAKSYSYAFQLYLVEGSRDQIGSQYSYCYSIEEDPRTYNEAMQSRDAAFWKEAIDDEIGSIMENNTWVLSDLPPGCKPLGCKWIFKRKMKVDGTIDKFKARLVIQGFRQKEGIDYFDTYAPVARITTIRLLLALAAIHNLVIHQMDVKTTFLNGDLEEEVYMKQPEGFVMPGNEHKVCKLVKSLYGLKQAPKQWHQKFDEVVLSSGFLLNQYDKCVYHKFDSSGKGVIICLYIDDMLIFGTDQNQVDKTKKLLSSKFSMKDMGEADVILGIKIKRENKGIVITQSHYIEKILKKFNREDCSPVSTPMDPVEKLMPNTGKPVDQLEYSRAIGCLMYAMTSTRRDIAYVVGRLSRFTSNLSRQHWHAITRVFKYLKGTMNYGLSYVGYPSVLEAYSDASWINHVEDSSSTSGWVFLLGGGAISWASKKTTLERAVKVSVVAAVECVERYLFQDHDFLRRWEGKIDNTESCNVDDLTSQHCRYLARLMPLIREESTIVSGPDLFSQSDYYPENKAVNEGARKDNGDQYDQWQDQKIKDIVCEERKGFRYGIRSNRQTATGSSDTVINLWHDSTAADKAEAVEIELLEYIREWNTKLKLSHIARFVLLQVFTPIPPIEIVEMKGVRELLKEAIITLIEPKSLKVENGGLVDKSEERTKREEETKELSSAKEVEENENVAASSVVTPVPTVPVLQGELRFIGGL